MNTLTSVSAVPLCPPFEHESAPLRILLLDDDPAYSHLCQRYLSRDGLRDYDVVAAASAAEGIEACLSQSFDCLLVDYCLPDITGAEILKTLRDKMGSGMPPAIVMSAMGGQAAASEAVRAGAIDFLQKGVVSSECLARSISNAVEKGELKRSIDERTTELLDANIQLQSRNEEIQRFYQSISHEVKTPLAAAREFIAIVLDGITGEVNEEQKEMLVYARESCDQLAEHFNDLVDMTQLEAGKASLNKQWVSLDGLIKRCLASMKAAFEFKEIEFIGAIPDDLPLALVDGNRFVQVISNLVGNAIKYTPRGGEVRLSVELDEASQVATISVADSGCGIKKSDLVRIFDRLYQVKPREESEIEAGLGLGLGLSIAKELVELHHGEIWAESEERQGSTFVVRLPIGAEASAAN